MGQDTLKLYNSGGLQICMQQLTTVRDDVLPKDY